MDASISDGPMPRRSLEHEVRAIARSVGKRKDGRLFEPLEPSAPRPRSRSQRRPRPSGRGAAGVVEQVAVACRAEWRRHGRPRPEQDRARGESPATASRRRRRRGHQPGRRRSDDDPDASRNGGSLSWASHGVAGPRGCVADAAERLVRVAGRRLIRHHVGDHLLEVCSCSQGSLRCEAQSRLGSARDDETHGLEARWSRTCRADRMPSTPAASGRAGPRRSAGPSPPAGRAAAGRGRG
jgi:hypothetical protein